MKIIDACMLETVVSLLLDSHHQISSIYHANHDTCSLQLLVLIPILQQAGESQDPLGEWKQPFQDYQEVKEVSVEMLDDQWLPLVMVRTTSLTAFFFRDVRISFATTLSAAALDGAETVPSTP